MRFAYHVSTLLAFAGCAEPQPEPFDRSLVIQRLTVDAVTQPGELFRRNPELAAQFEDLFELVACGGGQPVALHIEGEVVDGQGFGTASFVLTTVEEGEPCDGAGTLLVQPVSYEDARTRDVRVRGPVFIDGATVDGRIPLGRFQIGDATLGAFPTWWALTVRGRELSSRGPGSDGPGFAFNTGEASALWPPQQLAGLMAAEGDERSVLDMLIVEDLQPDVDLDEDGLERWIAEGGEVVGCREAGAEERRPLAECTPENGFVDGYDLRLRFRLEPVDLRE